MTLHEATAILRRGGSMVELAEAIVAVIEDKNGSAWDLTLGLAHRGFVAEQAAFALYRRTGRPLPADVMNSLCCDLAEWTRWLHDHADEIRTPHETGVVAASARG